MKKSPMKKKRKQSPPRADAQRNPIARGKGPKPQRSKTLQSSHIDKKNHPLDGWLTSNDRAHIKHQFDKFIKNSKTFGALEDMETKVDTACVMIMNILQISRSAVKIPEPDSDGPSKKFLSFKRLIA